MNEKNIILSSYVGKNGELNVNPEDEQVLRWIQENSLEIVDLTHEETNLNETCDAKQAVLVERDLSQNFNQNQHHQIHRVETCDPKPEPSTERASRNCGTWSDTESKTLIESYIEVKEVSKDLEIFSNGFWKKISGLLVSKGLKKTWMECREKWKYLERTYKNNLNKKNNTGQSPPKWALFDEMHSALFKKPQINPVSTASSIAGFKRRLLEDMDNIEKVSEKKKRRKTKTAETKKHQDQPDWIKEAREEASMRHEERKQQHEENMRRKDEVIALWKELVSLKEKEKK